ncbi:pentapeptide repeat-containing protein [Rhizobium sp. NFR07]|uniref:pentapeptide repeat-containing protein n=1 Tax=Rhizobium sp. NFR07 TaxID=1566262 RepID=UPI000A748129|nr:pentapeptide repeat-containing protein [Rhizobium sp. NFR07]
MTQVVNEIRDIASRRLRASQRVAGLCSAAALLALGIIPAGEAAAIECRADPRPGIDWSGCKKRLLMLDGGNFEGANLSGADLSMTDLSRTNLKKANFNKTMLVRASLAGADAEGADFERAEGYRSNLSGISASGANFVSSEMQRANFSEGELNNVDFTKAELGRALFFKAKLGNVRFAMANLSRASFHTAEISGPIDFTSAFLFLTRIEGVDLSSATGLTQDQIALSCGDDNTKLPAGLQKPTQWPCEDD